MRGWPFLKHADIKKQYDIPAIMYRVSMTVSTDGSEYWKTAPDGHSYVMKNTSINRGTIHTIRLFRYQAHVCSQLSRPINIMASWKNEKNDVVIILSCARTLTRKSKTMTRRFWFRVLKKICLEVYFFFFLSELATNEGLYNKLWCAVSYGVLILIRFDRVW